MASTNKTSHYNLSQYSANDKPTYLVDYNGDMLNIDNGIFNAQSKANNNETNIGNLSALTTTAKNSIVNAINEIVGVNQTQTENINTNTSNISVNATSIGTLNNLDTTNKSNLVSAINEVNSKAKGNGRLIASGYFTTNASNSTTATDAFKFSDAIFPSKIATINNYEDGILEFENNKIKVNTKGIVKYVKATFFVGGKSEGATSIWFLSNDGAFPEGVTSPQGESASQNLGMGSLVTNGYSGCSYGYVYNVNTTSNVAFFVDPAVRPYGGGFTPSTGGIKSSVIVEVYS